LNLQHPYGACARALGISHRAPRAGPRAGRPPGTQTSPRRARSSARAIAARWVAVPAHRHDSRSPGRRSRTRKRIAISGMGTIVGICPPDGYWFSLPPGARGGHRRWPPSSQFQGAISADDEAEGSRRCSSTCSPRDGVTGLGRRVRDELVRNTGFIAIDAAFRVARRCWLGYAGL
jgi:hypothetical protein